MSSTQGPARSLLCFTSVIEIEKTNQLNSSIKRTLPYHIYIYIYIYIYVCVVSFIRLVLVSLYYSSFLYKQSICHYTNGPHNPSIRIDMDPIYIVYLGRTGICLYKSPEKKFGLGDWKSSPNSGDVCHFYKDIFLKSKIKHVNGIHVYLDILVMGPLM